VNVRAHPYACVAVNMTVNIATYRACCLQPLPAQESLIAGTLLDPGNRAIASTNADEEGKMEEGHPEQRQSPGIRG
jgi:hypothetical protein